jgi:hypothetical protein
LVFFSLGYAARQGFPLRGKQHWWPIFKKCCQGRGVEWNLTIVFGLHSSDLLLFFVAVEAAVAAAVAHLRPRQLHRLFQVLLQPPVTLEAEHL